MLIGFYLEKNYISNLLSIVLFYGISAFSICLGRKLLFEYFLLKSFLFMVYTEITIFAYPFRIELPVFVLTFSSLLSSSFQMVAVLAHAISIILLWSMGTVWNAFSILILEVFFQVSWFTWSFPWVVFFWYISFVVRTT